MGASLVQLEPVIGTISATRDILTLGAELSLVGEQAPLVRTMTELGVNAGVVIALSIALVLVRRFARLDSRNLRTGVVAMIMSTARLGGIP